jgi:hypothetical protein
MTDMPKEMVPFPSGSKWGGKELDRIDFEVQSKQHPLRDFPWTNFFQETRIDPTEISSDIEALFRLEARQGLPINTVETRAFYGALKQLQGQFIAPKSPNVHRIRSTAVDPLSSSPLFSLSPTRRPPPQIVSNGELSLEEYIQQSTSFQTLSNRPTGVAQIPNQQHGTHYQLFGEESWGTESKRTPLAAYVNRRRSRLEDREPQLRSPLQSAAGTSQNQTQTVTDIISPSFLDTNPERDQPSSQDSSFSQPYRQPPRTPGRVASEQEVTFLDQLYPSSQSQSDSNYQ